MSGCQTSPLDDSVILAEIKSKMSGIVSLLIRLYDSHLRAFLTAPWFLNQEGEMRIALEAPFGHIKHLCQERPRLAQ